MGYLGLPVDLERVPGSSPANSGGGTDSEGAEVARAPPKLSGIGSEPGWTVEGSGFTEGLAWDGGRGSRMHRSSRRWM